MHILMLALMDFQVSQEEDRFFVCIKDFDVGDSGEPGREPYGTERSKSMSTATVLELE